MTTYLISAWEHLKVFANKQGFTAGVDNQCITLIRSDGTKAKGFRSPREAIAYLNGWEDAVLAHKGKYLDKLIPEHEDG